MSTAAPHQTVQLLHTLPDGSSHIDWMLDPAPTGGVMMSDEQPGGDDQREPRLLTWRLEKPLHDLEPGQQLTAERISDHRRRYLTWEGPTSGGRGHVRQIATGMATYAEAHPELRMLNIRWRFPGCEQQVQQRLRIEQNATTVQNSHKDRQWLIYCEARGLCVVDDREHGNGNDTAVDAGERR